MEISCKSQQHVTKLRTLQCNNLSHWHQAVPFIKQASFTAWHKTQHRLFKPGTYVTKLAFELEGRWTQHIVSLLPRCPAASVMNTCSPYIPVVRCCQMSVPLHFYWIDQFYGIVKWKEENFMFCNSLDIPFSCTHFFSSSQLAIFTWPNGPSCTWRELWG